MGGITITNRSPIYLSVYLGMYSRCHVINKGLAP